MFCRKCGKPVPEGQNFCPNCGVKLISQDTTTPLFSESNTVNSINNLRQSAENMNTGNQSVAQPNFTNPTQPQNLQADDDLTEAMVRAYVGEEKADFFMDKFKNGGLVWQSFVLNNLYFFYRKNFLGYLAPAVAISCVIGALTGLIPNSAGILSVIQIIALILIGFAFIPTYKKKVYAAVEKIQKNNPACSKEELIGIARVKGGVSINWVMLCCGLFILIFAIVPLATQSGLHGAAVGADPLRGRGSLRMGPLAPDPPLRRHTPAPRQNPCHRPLLPLRHLGVEARAARHRRGLRGNPLIQRGMATRGRQTKIKFGRMRKSS